MEKNLIIILFCFSILTRLKQQNLMCSEKDFYYNTEKKLCQISCDLTISEVDKKSFTCTICKDIGKVKVENIEKCVDNCPENYFNSDGKCLSICTIENKVSQPIGKNSDFQCRKSCSKHYSLSSSNTCVLTCPYGKIINGKCLNCSNFYSVKGDCLDKCPQLRYGDDSNICLPCSTDSNIKNNIVKDGVCTTTCESEIYEIKNFNLYDKTDLILKEFRVCSLISKNSICKCGTKGSCILDKFSVEVCSCQSNYYGSKCQLSLNEVDDLKKELNLLIPTINSLSSYHKIIEQAPEIFDEEFFSNLVFDIERKLESNYDMNMSEFDQLFTIKQLTNNTINFENLIKELEKSIIKNINKIENNIFIGNSFSVQILNDIDESINLARQYFLPFREFKSCELQMKSMGIIKENEKLLQLNINIKSKIRKEYLTSNNILSSTSFMISKILNENYKQIDSSVCSNIKLEFPVPKEVTNYNKYWQIKSIYNTDIFNKSDSFFKDICFKYQGENRTDIPLNARKDIFYNEVKCSNDCKYLGINTHGYVMCECKQYNDLTYAYFINAKFDDLFDNNIWLVLCFKEVINNHILKNYGAYSGLILFFIGITVITINCCLGKSFVRKNKDQLIYNDGWFGIAPNEIGQSSSPKNENLNVVTKKNSSKSFSINSNLNLNINSGTNRNILTDKSLKVNNNEEENNNNKIIPRLKISNESNNDINVLQINKNFEDSPKKHSSKFNNFMLSDKTLKTIKSQVEVFSSNNITTSNKVSSQNLNEKIKDNKLSIYYTKNLNKKQHNKESDLNLAEKKSERSAAINKDRERRRSKINVNFKQYLDSSDDSGKVKKIEEEIIINENELNQVHKQSEINSFKIMKKDSATYNPYNLNEKNIKFKEIPSEKDLKSLPIELQLEIDNRGFCEFFWNSLKIEHSILSLMLYKSILHPFWIRTISIILLNSLIFSISAYVYDSGYIYQEMKDKNKYGENSITVIYIFKNEMWKLCSPIIFAYFFSMILNLLISAPLDYKIELNNFLIKQDEKSIEEGMY